MILGSRIKDPVAKKTISIDWSTWLTSIVDTMDSFVWTVPAGLTNDAESHTTTQANVRVADGTTGQSYLVACVITTTSGEVERAFVEVVVE